MILGPNHPRAVRRVHRFTVAFRDSETGETRVFEKVTTWKDFYGIVRIFERDHIPFEWDIEEV